MIFKTKALLVLALIHGAICLAGDDEQVKILGNFKNDSAVKEVLDGKRKVANASWWGFDVNDATQAIQGAINSGAAKVIIPYVGKEWVVRPIKLASNQEVIFDPGVVVMAKEGQFKGKFDCLFEAFGKNNITLTGYGATLRMRKKDYTGPMYTKAEWRHTLGFFGCTNITVEGLTLRDSGGDGIYVGGDREDPTPPPSRNIRILNCVCDNNHRQGISVTAVSRLRIENCVLSNTRGTNPAAGIDLEPCNAGQMLANVVVSNCIAENNSGSGFIASISGLTERSPDVSILFVNCYARNCGDPGLRVRAVNENGPKGLIEFRNCTSENTSDPGGFVHWEKVDCPMKVRFSDCKFQNVGTRHNQVPIGLSLKRKKAVNQTGQIKFVNCYVYDNRDRPFLKITGIEGSEGVYDVAGEINVCNPYGAKIDIGTTDEKLALKVNPFTIQE